MNLFRQEPDKVIKRSSGRQQRKMHSAQQEQTTEVSSFDTRSDFKNFNKYMTLWRETGDIDHWHMAQSFLDD